MGHQPQAPQESLRAIGGTREALAAKAEADDTDKFSEAVSSVAIVLQIKEPLQPTPAEAEREQLYGGPDGMELASLLGKEAALWKSESGFAEARTQLATAVPAATALRESIATLRADGGDAAAGDVAGLLGSVEAALGSANDLLASASTAPLEPFVKEAAAGFETIRKVDLDTVVGPYAIMGVILLGIFGLFAWKLPKGSVSEGDSSLHIGATVKRLLGNSRYWEGVIAQTFYVGAQIMCWTFIIQYAESELGLSKATAQNCNILAMLIFVSSRFVCTFLLHYIHAGMLLGLLAAGGIVLILGTIFIHGYAGLYCLIGVSACMSLMFPTIYGFALKGLGDDVKLGSAGLILAIGGGCLMPPLQGRILDMPAFDLGFMELASVRASFFLPLICFMVIAHYGWRTVRHHGRA